MEGGVYYYYDYDYFLEGGAWGAQDRMDNTPSGLWKLENATAYHGEAKLI
jgi:hypothetical protein